MTDLYQSQRAMRNMRRAAMQRGVIAALDVGTSKIACLILRFDGPDRLREADGVGPMAGQSSFRVIGAATTRSRGVRFGEISVMNETERAIRTAVQAAQKMANVRVDHAIVCFSGAEPRSYGLAGEWDLQDSVVTEQDVARVLSACEVPNIGEGREVLHAQPVNFALDHRSGLGDPRGQIGNRLACDMHLLSVDASVIQNLLYCIKRCDLELAGIASSAYVAGISSLVEDEQELGAACIDMGGGSTGLSIFIKKHMIYADAVRMGGDHVTSDISKGLQVPVAVAERIKTRHGGVQATGMDDREMIVTCSTLPDRTRRSALATASSSSIFADVASMSISKDDFGNFSDSLDRIASASAGEAPSMAIRFTRNSGRASTASQAPSQVLVISSRRRSSDRYSPTVKVKMKAGKPTRSIDRNNGVSQSRCIR